VKIETPHTNSAPARTREIMIVGPRHDCDSLKTQMARHLDNAFKEAPGAPFFWEFSGCPHPQDLSQALTLKETPFLVLFDTQKADLAESSPLWDAACTGLRELDSSTCILVLHEQEVPSSELSITWLDRGASGLFQPNSPPPSTEDALRDMLSLPLKIKVPRKVRLGSKHKVEIQLSSLEQALVAETLNIGLGGLFIRAVPQNIRANDEVDFVLQFSSTTSDSAASANSNPLVDLINQEASKKASADVSEIRGSGIVVWVRTTAKNGVPEGIGIQFTDVDDAGFKKLKDFIASHRIKAFIPKA
jgi:hypothetical protein